MLTLFATPKPFRGHIGVIQRNAIGSWRQLTPTPQIILFGDSEGTKEIASEFGLEHVPQVESNEFGTPFLRSLIEKAEVSARYNLLCYINADIIVTVGFERAALQVSAKMKRFLMVGRRTNMRLEEPIRFDTGWRERLEAEVAARALAGDHTGIDFFLFPRNFYHDVPPLVIGRAWFDHWMIQAALDQRAPVVNVSPLVSIVHQTHDYAHVPGGSDWVYGGVEAERNLAICGGKHTFTLLDATHELSPDGRIRRVFLRRFMWRTRELFWRVFVEKTHPLRKRLGLQRRAQRKAHAASQTVGRPVE
jgi:hypothetical protein